YVLQRGCLFTNNGSPKTESHRLALKPSLTTNGWALCYSLEFCSNTRVSHCVVILLSYKCHLMATDIERIKPHDDTDYTRGGRRSRHSRYDCHCAEHGGLSGTHRC